MHRLALVVSLLLIPGATAQVLEDPAGDVRIAAYENGTDSPHSYDAVDMVAIYIDETPDTIEWSVEVAAVAQDAGTGQCPDTGDLRSFFNYGKAHYNVQQGVRPDNCQPYGLLFETFGADFSRRFLAELDTVVEGNVVTATIPRELLLDDAGTPPIAGRQITDVRARSFNTASLGGPDLTDPFSQEEKDWLVVADDMPDDQQGVTYQFQQGGLRRQGDLIVHSESPFRSSNGGAGVFTFDVIATNPAAPVEATISLLGVPATWQTAHPQNLRLATGTTTFTVAVETPFGHQHGGSDTFAVRIDAEAAWAEADLGIHYLAIPQPAGHHDQVWLHNVPVPQPFATVFAGGDGLFAINTTEGGGGHQGWYADGLAGSQVAWIACLQDGLKLGLDWNPAKDGWFKANLDATKLYPGATIQGRIIHLGPGPALPFCAPPFYGDRTITEMATMEPQSIGDLQGAVSVEMPIIPAVDRVPYQPGATMVFELWLDHDLVNTPGPSTLTMSGAHARLPLDEYYDERPAGLIGGGDDAPAVTDDIVKALDNTAGEEPVQQDAPAPLVAAMMAFACAALVVRRRT